MEFSNLLGREEKAEVCFIVRSRAPFGLHDDDGVGCFTRRTPRFFYTDIMGLDYSIHFEGEREERDAGIGGITHTKRTLGQHLTS